MDEHGELVSCGCCGRARPRTAVAELGVTPGVFICTGCALWAARRSSRLIGDGSSGARVLRSRAVRTLRSTAVRTWRSAAVRLHVLQPHSHGSAQHGSHGHPGDAQSAIPILPSADLDRTVAFWRTFGFVVAARYDGYLVTHSGGVELHFSAGAPRSPGTASVSLTDSPSGPGASPARAFVHVEDAGDRWAQLSAAAAVGLGPIEEKPYGLREFVVTDPDGNRVRFGSPL